MKLRLFLIGLCVACMGIVMPKTVVSAEQSDKVYTEYITGDELKELQDYMVSHTIDMMRTTRAITWTVPASTRYKTGSFSKSANSVIIVDVSLSASGRVGVIGFDGQMDYRTGTRVSWNFTTWSSQTYCVFVQNNSSSSITANGNYVY